MKKPLVASLILFGSLLAQNSASAKILIESDYLCENYGNLSSTSPDPEDHDYVYIGAVCQTTMTGTEYIKEGFTTKKKFLAEKLNRGLAAFGMTKSYLAEKVIAKDLEIALKKFPKSHVFYESAESKYIRALARQVEIIRDAEDEETVYVYESQFVQALLTLSEMYNPKIVKKAHELIEDDVAIFAKVRNALDVHQKMNDIPEDLSYDTVVRTMNSDNLFQMIEEAVDTQEAREVTTAMKKRDISLIAANYTVNTILTAVGEQLGYGVHEAVVTGSKNANENEGTLAEYFHLTLESIRYQNRL